MCLNWWGLVRMIFEIYFRAWTFFLLLSIFKESEKVDEVDDFGYRCEKLKLPFFFICIMDELRRDEFDFDGINS